MQIDCTILVYLCTEMMTYIANISQVKYTFPPASLSRRISTLFINTKEYESEEQFLCALSFCVYNAQIIVQNKRLSFPKMSFGHSIVLLTSSTSWKSLTMASCMTDMSTTLLAITCRSSLPRSRSSATISSMYSACMSCLQPEKTLSLSTSPSPHLRKETLKQWFMSSTTLKLWLKTLAFLLHSLQHRFDSLRNSPMSRISL